MLFVLSRIYTLYSQRSFSPSISGFIPNLTGVCACVLRKHFLYEESILTAFLLKVEILGLLDLFSIMQPDHLRGRISYIQNTSHLQMIKQIWVTKYQWDKIKNNQQQRVPERQRVEYYVLQATPHTLCLKVILLSHINNAKNVSFFLFFITSASSYVAEVTCSCK